MTRVLALCADDFGQSAAVDRGILRLAGRGRLTEVSCMANMPAWAADAKALMALPSVAQGRLKVGLHFNLTEGRPLSAALSRIWPRLPELPRLIMMAQLRLLPLAQLRDEWRAQLEAFEQACQQPPSHVDGHQHVHHLPGLRQLLLQELAARPGVTVRDTGRVRGPGFGVKRMLIERTGGIALSRQLARLGRQANTELLGVYDFIEADYRRLMQGWLAALPAQGALIFCHAGEADAQTSDPIAAARVRELTYLESQAFAEDLASAGVQLARSA